MYNYGLMLNNGRMNYDIAFAFCQSKFGGVDNNSIIMLVDWFCQRGLLGIGDRTEPNLNCRDGWCEETGIRLIRRQRRCENWRNGNAVGWFIFSSVHWLAEGVISCC
jgi:hypothetical protein